MFMQQGNDMPRKRKTIRMKTLLLCWSLLLYFVPFTMQNPQDLELFDDSFEEMISKMDDNWNLEMDFNLLQEQNSILLRCVDSAGITKRLWLEEFWSHGLFKEGDCVRAFLPNNLAEMHEFHISNSSGAVVVNPGTIVAVNKISGAVFCRRKSVLTEMLKSFDRPILRTQVGIIAHQMFQDAVKESISDLGMLRNIILKIMNKVDFLQNQYYYDIDPAVVHAELEVPVKSTAKFVQNFLSNRSPFPGVMPSTVLDRVLAVEEEMISEKFGIRGSIDMTVAVKAGPEQKSTLMPLELKTGKQSFVGDHAAQVMLYCLLFSNNNHETCERGLLYYFGGSELQAVDTKMNELHGLLRLRNEIAYYLYRFFDDPDTCDFMLPDPICNVKICRQCPQLLNCCLTQKNSCQMTLDGDSRWDAMAEAELCHLNEEELQYVKRWTRWYRMEGAEQRLRGKKNSYIDYDEEEYAIGEYLIFKFFEPFVFSRDHNADECSVAMRVQQFSEDLRIMTLAPLSNVNLNRMFSHFDQVLLNGIGERTSSLFATVITVELQQISVQFSRSYRFMHSCDFLVKRVNTKFYFDTAMSSVYKLMVNDTIANRKRQLIINLDEPRFRTNLPFNVVQKMKPFCKSLNAEQKSAIVKAMMAEDYLLIKGFPGSGKSSTIVALIQILIENGNSVLVCAYTNSAVDHILLKLKAHTADILRLGPLFSMHSDMRQFTPEAIFGNEPQLDLIVRTLSSTMLVGCTCTSAALHPLLKKRKFDVCIVDEATLATEASTLGPLLAAHKFVLVGDPLQLRPLVQSERLRKEGMDISLFSKLEQKYPNAVVTLKRQYRMNREICLLSDQMFYNGELIVANDEVGNTFLNVAVSDDVAEEPWVRRCLSSAPEHAVVFLDTSNCENNSATRDGAANVENELELDLVVKLCQTFSKSGLDDDQIGVMSIYRTQVESIRRSLKSSGSIGVEVNTIDQYQGKDKDVIIISFVWTKELKRKQNAICPLLKDVRRVNVALTRARKKLILIGHFEDLRADHSIFETLHSILSESQIFPLVL
ncbi:DNA replication ATP-dependent helicase/nuclease DNA2 [Trichinella pseudospiralis]|uniref:DNA replication ATP-dependent helicase/nuclease n=1 Tax=Trichinella pseudospiralis TaxID=6337 RepID=A0A0V1FA23_TRIPS|nr:DNA replication ATP-dependent helicase/nuclease DNA2 [Trichinella pseudospiralis]